MLIDPTPPPSFPLYANALHSVPSCVVYSWHSTTPTRTPTPTPTRQTRLQSYTSDTRYFLARPREEIACVGRKIVAVFGESVSVSVSVSASWNASISYHIVSAHSSACLVQNPASFALCECVYVAGHITHKSLEYTSNICSTV